MTTEQIRKIPLFGIDVKADSMSRDDVWAVQMAEQNLFLREIALQLCIHNEREERNWSGIVAPDLSAERAKGKQP